MLNNSLWDAQTIYGSGTQGLAPTNALSATDNLYSSWGARMDGSNVMQFDGVSRPYSYKGNNQDRYYRTGTTFSNTVSLSTSGEKGNTRFGFTNMNNDDIAPESGLDRNSLSINTSQKLGKNISLDASIKYITEDQAGNPNVSDGPGNANWVTKQYAPSVDVMWGQGPNGNGTQEDGLNEYVFTSGIYITNPWFAQNMYVKDLEKERFIGAMNFINGTVMEAKNEIGINSDILGPLTISRSQVFGDLTENKIIIGIRPERISIVSDGSSVAGSISGKITDASYFGETTYYKVTCGKGSETLTVSAQNSFGQMDYQIGEEVKLNVDIKSLVCFLD